MACPFRKSYPDVMVMQAGQDRDGDNDTEPLNGPPRGVSLSSAKCVRTSL